MSHQPVNTWGLDPLFSCYRKLLIGHMKSLKIVQHGMCFEFYIADRSVQRVEVAGYVVSKKVASKKVVLYIDDGTGVIQCSKFYDESDYDKSLPFAVVNLGDVVAIRGRIVMFNEEMVLWAVSVDVLTDPNAELLHWASAMHLHQTCYRRPMAEPGLRPWVETSPFGYCSCRPSRNRTVCRDVYIYCPCQQQLGLGLGAGSGLGGHSGVVTEQTDHSTRVDSNAIFSLIEANNVEFGELEGVWTYSEHPVSLNTQAVPVGSAAPGAADTCRKQNQAAPLVIPCNAGSSSNTPAASSRMRFVMTVLQSDRPALSHFSCFLLHYLHIKAQNQNHNQNQAQTDFFYWTDISSDGALLRRAADFIQFCDRRFRQSSAGSMVGAGGLDGDWEWCADADTATDQMDTAAVGVAEDSEMSILAIGVLVTAVNHLATSGVVSISVGVPPPHGARSGTDSGDYAGGISSEGYTVRAISSSEDYTVRLNSAPGLILGVLRRHQRDAIGLRIPTPDQEGYIIGRAVAELTGSPHFIPEWRVTYCWRDYRLQCMRL